MYWELLPFSKFAKTSFCKKCGVTPFYQMTAEMTYNVLSRTFNPTHTPVCSGGVNVKMQPVLAFISLACAPVPDLVDIYSDT